MLTRDTAEAQAATIALENDPSGALYDEVNSFTERLHLFGSLAYAAVVCSQSSDPSVRSAASDMFDSDALTAFVTLCREWKLLGPAVLNTLVRLPGRTDDEEGA